MSNIVYDKAFLVALGKRIETLRKAKKMSQYKLSYDSDIPRSTIQRLEKGDINSSLSVIPFLARALGVSPKELLDFEQ